MLGFRLSVKEKIVDVEGEIKVLRILEYFCFQAGS